MRGSKMINKIIILLLLVCLVGCATPKKDYSICFIEKNYVRKNYIGLYSRNIPLPILKFDENMVIGEFVFLDTAIKELVKDMFKEKYCVRSSKILRGNNIDAVPLNYKNKRAVGITINGNIKIMFIK